MKQLIVVPKGWSCSPAELPPGHFTTGVRTKPQLESKLAIPDGVLYFKTQAKGGRIYGQDGRPIELGEGVSCQPVKVEWAFDD